MARYWLTQTASSTEHGRSQNMMGYGSSSERLSKAHCWLTQTTSSTGHGRSQNMMGYGSSSERPPMACCWLTQTASSTGHGRTQNMMGYGIPAVTFFEGIIDSRICRGLWPLKYLYIGSVHLKWFSFRNLPHFTSLYFDSTWYTRCQMPAIISKLHKIAIFSPHQQKESLKFYTIILKDFCSSTNCLSMMISTRLI